MASPAWGEWRAFRGSDGRGVSDQRVPLAWSEQENVAWRAPLVGRGPSSPIVVGGRVIVTCSSGPEQDRLHVLCFDEKTGERLWHRQFWATGRTLCHPASAVAANTPASDGHRIYALFSSNDLACLDLDGNLIWYRGLTHDHPAAANDVGMASSVLAVEGTVIVQIECQGDSFAAGIDASTGETRWRHARDRRANYSSPAYLPATAEAPAAALLQSASGLTAVDPYSGETRWTLATDSSTTPSIVVADGTVYLPANGLMALRPGRSGAPGVVWQQGRLSPTACSPIVHDGCVYTVNRTVLNCGDAASGEPKWQLRLAGGQYWATPVIAGEHLYAINYDGVAEVVRVGRNVEQGEVVGRSELGEQIQATPAISNGALFIRSDRHLWKIGG
jgi:outer membrane protein assembly factor BamB